MPYRYLDEVAIADVAFEASGATIEEMFISAADATLETMLDNIDSIRRDRMIEIHIEENDLEMLVFSFLEEIVYRKDAERLLAKVETVDIEMLDNRVRLDASAWGDPIDPSRHHLSADVKAVTFYRLKVEETPEGWRAVVVLDI